VKPLVLRLRAAPEQRLDMSSLTPQRLAGKSLREIDGVELQTTRRAVRVGDLFDASDGSAEHIVIAGGSERFDRVGEGMSAGSITVDGDVGIRAGRRMAGGRPTNGGPLPRRASSVANGAPASRGGVPTSQQLCNLGKKFVERSCATSRVKKW
jgi:formylmethanofuran dehydrogenase subunit C